MNVLYVAIGGFFGAIARFGISNWVKARYKGKFPYATFFVNIVGAFLLGLLTGAKVGHIWLLLFGTGFMGAFTTFSTFQLEAVQLYIKKDNKILLVYVTLTYIIGICFAYIGFLIGRM
ncbi:fluoride efflux transporter CrcB [Microbacteriaceae bacterium 4G12]